MARDYTHERLIEKPSRVKLRAKRNAARRKVEQAGVKVAGKQVHHLNGDVKDNRIANLKAVNPNVHNHGRAGAQGGKLKKK